VAALKKVTPEQVHRAAQEVLDWKRSNLALIGPVEDEARLRELIQP
jgi:predicted Zn-dependent peptidase